MSCRAIWIRIPTIFSSLFSQCTSPGYTSFSRKYFRLLKSVFAEDCELLIITKDENVVSAVMSFYFRDEVLPYYGGGTDAARDLAGNDFMYWELMRRACERGYRVFDFGRSKRGTGSYSFKRTGGLSRSRCFMNTSSIKQKRFLNIIRLIQSISFYQGLAEDAFGSGQYARPAYR